VLDTPRLAQTRDQLTAVVRFTITQGDDQAAVSAGYKEVMGAITAQGISPAGPWFTHHLKMDMESHELEVGVPVLDPVSRMGRVVPGRWPASTVARAVLVGSYESLWPAWVELNAWIARQGHTPGPDLWECYVRGPESTPDPDSWRTELNRPLIRVADKPPAL
jgi:effector-binding domain-containing protein